MKNSSGDQLGLSLTKIASHMPDNCDGPFIDVPLASIGSLLHNICAAFLNGLSSSTELQARLWT